LGKTVAVIGAIYAVIATTKHGDAQNPVSFLDFWKVIAKAGLVLVTMHVTAIADRTRPSRTNGDFLAALTCVALVYFLFTSQSLSFISALAWAVAVAVFAHTQW
jgi:putative exporter of polyketide antibiotics